MTSNPSSAFDSLHPDIQRWIWKQDWSTLREVQEKSIPPILAADRDVVISAATAAGKTEAAFLPLATRMAQTPPNRPGFQALVISPLKALINDQYDRLEDLLGAADIPVHKRHGDVSGTARRKALADPAGVLLITPESLEALFINKGHQIPMLFAPLSAIVVDELHAFIGTERGMQLQSLMHRLELALRRRLPRLGLSATLGDMELAGDFLRPDGAYPRELVTTTSGGQSVRLKLHGVETGGDRNGDEAISRTLFEILRGDTHLVFANARNRVELYAGLLRDQCEKAGVINEFWPHHGNLSKSLREDAERALKSTSRPATALCTSTLEMGIDIGKVASIAQLGCPPSVAALRQRMGRSGRRGESATLRMYIQEPVLCAKSALLDHLRMGLFQSIAMINLMTRSWIEPPDPQRPHLSTLVQQTLSLLAQWGELTAAEIYNVLCKEAPFTRVDISTFKLFLRDLAGAELIKQLADGKFILDGVGEQLVNHYTFYAAFQTPQTYRLMHDGRTLGELPIDFPLVEKQAIIFAGRRWIVQSINVEELFITLKPAHGGAPPLFGGGGASVHDEVRQEMRHLYLGTNQPPFIDSEAQKLLQQGRNAFSKWALFRESIIEDGRDAVLFPWMGDRIQHTLVLWLTLHNQTASQEWAAIRVENSRAADLQELLANMAQNGPPDPMALAAMVKEKRIEKYHAMLSDELLNWEWAYGGMFDSKGAWAVAQGITKRSAIDNCGILPPNGD